MNPQHPDHGRPCRPPALLTALLGLSLLLPTPLLAASLRIVATLPDLAAIARDIGGDRVSVEALVLPTQDPHFVDARPSMTLGLHRADLLILAGADLEEGWLPTLQVGARNAAIQPGAPGLLDASTLVELLDVQAERVDRSMGHVHPSGNPHYNYDPRRMHRVARGIAARLQQLDPGGAAHYAAGLTRFEQRLEAAIGRWESRLAPLRGRAVITYHQSFIYLSDWLGLRAIATLEPKPGIPPTPGHIQRALALADTDPPVFLLQERWYPARTAQLVAARLGVPLLIFEGGADLRAGQDYIAFMDSLVEQLAGAAGLAE